VTSQLTATESEPPPEDSPRADSPSIDTQPRACRPTTVLIRRWILRNEIRRSRNMRGTAAPHSTTSAHVASRYSCPNTDSTGPASSDVPTTAGSRRRVARLAAARR
jgi:hypothetical protein